MLKLRRAIVVDAEPPASAIGVSARADVPGEQRLTVELSDARGVVRPAIADTGLVGVAQAGDEVIVNTQALDLGLGSGGFDIVHANLTRGLGGGPAGEAHVMKLNYTSL